MNFEVRFGHEVDDVGRRQCDIPSRLVEPVRLSTSAPSKSKIFFKSEFKGQPCWNIDIVFLYEEAAVLDGEKWK